MAIKNTSIILIKSPLTQTVLGKVGQITQFIVQFEIPLDAINYNHLEFIDYLPKALTLLPTSTIQINQRFPEPLNAQVTMDKVVSKSFVNPDSLAGSKITITLNLQVDDISKIPDNREAKTIAEIVIDNDPNQSYRSNEVSVIYQFEDVFNIQKSPLFQQLSKAINTPVSFNIIFNIPLDVSELTSLKFTDSLDPVLIFDSNTSFLQIGSDIIGLLPATVTNNVVNSDLTSYLTQAAGKTIKITLGTLLRYPQYLPTNDTIENRAIITLNDIPAYSFTSNIVSVKFGFPPIALPITKTPYIQYVDLVQGKAINFTLTFTLPEDLSEYQFITFSDTLANSLTYDNANSTVQFGNATPLPLEAMVINNTVSKTFDNLQTYAGQKVTIKLATLLNYPEYVPTNRKVTNVAQLVVNGDITLTSNSNVVTVIFRKISPYQPGINDIIESVALEQTALSHILNAEGEKIQKALQIPDVTSEQLLAINHSVKKMVNSITKLEIVLTLKIETVN